MISYAQNGEDVVLARILGDGPGFYVDCGAADPMNASVTRHFYEHGWRGINIEPRADAAEEVAAARPEDVTLNAAVGEADGTVTFHVRADDPHQSSVLFGGADTEAVTVPMRSLDSILAEHAPERIDFLKIDVEGYEEAVLKGIDLHSWRPTVIVIEAVKPWSTERTDDAWRHLITERGYDEALFDGINLFFVAQEAEIAVPVPPASVLDRFVTARQHELQQRVEELSWVLEGTPGEQPAVPRSVPTPRERFAEAPPARWAVVGPDGAAEARLRQLLAAAADAVEVAVEHPGDIDWETLPERCVLQLDWRPTRLLTSLLAEHDVRPVCLGEVADWWDLPGTVRLPGEEFDEDPDTAVRRALESVGYPLPR